ncbi:MAG: amidohydrolase [Bryobacteraceae bacterium]|nr:amidohydrolase [Bryobacteraceae bacterium]
MLASCGGRERADLILHNGKIVTVDRRFTVAEAVAIRGERILAVGSTDTILKLAGEQTAQVDLGGKTVLPGLIDSHVHAPSAAMYEFDHTVPDMETIADVLAYIKSRAEALKPGQWIGVSQVFITRLKEQRYPTREELDRAAPRNPVAFRTGPDASLNSLALKLSGIDRNFQITDGKPGRVERDPKTGEPTGILRSCSRFIKDEPTGKKPTMEDRVQRLKALLTDYNSVGLTSIVDGDTSDEEVEEYRQLKERGELSCRTFMALSVDAQMPMDKIEARIREAAGSPLHQYDNMLWLRGVKSYLDGGMLTGSAFMRAPWGVSKVYSIDDPNYRGMLYIEPDKLYRIMKLALENELQFTAHSVGDGAVHAFVDAVDRIDKNDFETSGSRACITHCNFMSLEAINKMGELGVVANMQPAWLWLDGATLLKQFGPDRLEYFQPYRSLFQQRVIVGGGSDHMQKLGSLRSINPYNPFLGMWVAITRHSRWLDEPLRAEQAISREQAIRFYTSNNAYLTFEEKEKGSLEEGKLADLIVIDKDILTCAVDDIKEIRVERTYLGGRLIYSR